MAGYLKFSVENVENEFPHNLVGIVEHFLHDGRVSFTQRDNIGKNVSTRKGALIIKKNPKQSVFKNLFGFKLFWLLYRESFLKIDRNE